MAPKSTGATENFGKKGGAEERRTARLLGPKEMKATSKPVGSRATYIYIYMHVGSCMWQHNIE